MPDTSPHALSVDSLTREEFFLLATIAWLKSPNESLATQMSEATGVKVRSCQYWLSLIDQPRRPPADIVAAAHKAAAARFPAYADVLDKLDDITLSSKSPA